MRAVATCYGLICSRREVGAAFRKWGALKEQQREANSQEGCRMLLV